MATPQTRQEVIITYLVLMLSQLCDEIPDEMSFLSLLCQEIEETVVFDMILS